MPSETCGPTRNCAWRRALERSIRGQPTNPTRFCIALTQGGDPCGRLAEHHLSPGSWKEDVWFLEKHVGQPLCAVHYDQLHRYFVGPNIREHAPEVKPDAPPPKGTIYFGRRNGEVKIGFSTDPSKRFQALETQGGFRFEEIRVTKGTMQLERKYHKLFREHRKLGEWFTMAPEIRAVMNGLPEWDS